MIELASDMLPKDWTTTCQRTARHGWHVEMRCRHCRAALGGYTEYPDGSGLEAAMRDMVGRMARHVYDSHGPKPLDATFWLGVEGEQL